jgi:hypothetical protein
MLQGLAIRTKALSQRTRLVAAFGVAPVESPQLLAQGPRLAAQRQPQGPQLAAQQVLAGRLVALVPQPVQMAAGQREKQRLVEQVAAQVETTSAAFVNLAAGRLRHVPVVGCCRRCCS